jgi:hypothetical protein
MVKTINRKNRFDIATSNVISKNESYYQIQGIMPGGHFNKMADLQ